MIKLVFSHEMRPGTMNLYHWIGMLLCKFLKDYEYLNLRLYATPNYIYTIFMPVSFVLSYC